MSLANAMTYVKFNSLSFKVALKFLVDITGNILRKGLSPHFYQVTTLVILSMDFAKFIVELFFAN